MTKEANKNPQFLKDFFWGIIENGRTVNSVYNKTTFLLLSQIKPDNHYVNYRIARTAASGENLLRE